ncbi:MAG: VCBS repeat-containing protein, partial [Planctomycetales bacterium]|nr:VCBS repeat-containing protein [Planctomycetales bacterium]
GGTGANYVQDQSGQNDLRAGSNNRPEGDELDVMEDFQFAGMTSFEHRQIFDVVGSDMPAMMSGPAVEVLSDLTDPAGLEIVGSVNNVWTKVGMDDTPILEWHPSVQPELVLAGDFNGDGKSDIARFHFGNWYVSKSMSGGYVTGFWGSFATTGGMEDVNVGDFNGDGKDDIVYRVGGDVRVLVSNGGGFSNQQWGTWSETANWQNVMVGDFNGDGRDDLVSQVAGMWFVSTSTGSKFTFRRWVTTNDYILFAGIGDTNGDGRDDVVVRIGRYLRFLQSNGSEFVNVYGTTLGSTDLWDHAAIADIDGDGKSDLVVNRGDRFWYGISTGNALNMRLAGIIDLTWDDFIIADIDDDGADEVFFASATRLWMLGGDNGDAQQIVIADSQDGLPWTILVGNF